MMEPITKDNNPGLLTAILDILPQAQKVCLKRCAKGHRIEGVYKIQDKSVTVLTGTQDRSVEPWQKVPTRVYIDVRPPDDAVRGCKCGPQ